MSNHIESKSSDLLIELSNEQQEAVAGGRSSHSFGSYDFFLQMTNMTSFKSSAVNISSDSISSLAQSGSTFSQITIGINSSHEGGRGRKHRHHSGGLRSADLFSLLMSVL